MDYKKIHTTYFYYQFKKDRIRVLVMKDGNEYTLPNKYLTRDNTLNIKDNHILSIEDHYDLEVEYYQCMNVHKPKGSQWMELKDILKYRFKDNETYDVYFKIYDNLFKICVMTEWDNPFSRCEYIGFDSIKSYYQKIFDDVLQKRCKLKYIKWIQDEIDGNNHYMVFDGIYHPMDKELLKKELDTLEHFEMEKVYVRGCAYMHTYEFKIPDCETFGGSIEPIGGYIMLDKLPSSLNRKNG